MTMNTTYGGPEVLPFDLRSKRITTYTVHADAPEKAPVRNQLQKTFVAAIRVVLEKSKSPAPDLIDSTKPVREMIKGYSPNFFWKRCRHLAAYVLSTSTIWLDFPFHMTLLTS